MIRVRHLRHGLSASGGARHEQLLTQTLLKAIKSSGLDATPEAWHGAPRYRGLGHLRLLAKGYRYASGNINIVSARLALPAMLRARSSGAITLIVIHNYDPNDGKSKGLRLYYSHLFAYLRQWPERVAVVVVSPFFYNLLTEILPGVKVILFPNMFHTPSYWALRIQSLKEKGQEVNMGQWSTKNDKNLVELALELKELGYQPVFYTLHTPVSNHNLPYLVRKPTFDQYLRYVASSCVTLALPRLNEGWNRMAHESLLLGTPVIGYEKGGLGDLLLESRSNVVESLSQVAPLLESGLAEVHLSQDFIHKYDLEADAYWVKPIYDWIAPLLVQD